MTLWKKDRLLFIILIYTGLSVYEPAWRLLLRGLFEGADFQWQIGPIGGSGVGGHYWVVVTIVLYGFVMLWLGWRGGKRPFPGMLLIWALFLLSQSTGLLLSGSVYVGETIAAEFALDPLLFLVDLTYLILAIVWIARTRRRGDDWLPTAPWQRRNWFLSGTAVFLLLPIYLFLTTGEQHGTSDQLGVILTFVHWLILNAALIPAGQTADN
jgi:hypothetical protein